ncbi:MAG: hypothetical protein Q4B35_05160 [Slackia sp.]|nr:hypothetical protein [Slackia sp.]
MTMPIVFAISLACALALAVFAGPFVKKHAWVLYAPACALAVLYVAGVLGALPAPVRGAVFPLMQKGTLAMALFAIVMFTGVLARGSAPRRLVGRVRAEYSIAACILISGHMVAYALSYVPRVIASSMSNPYVALGLAAALVLAVLTAVLGVTSLSCVKARMEKSAWKKVQRWAYLFYGLSYAHVIAMLLPGAVGGGAAAMQSAVFYSVLFGSYALLRALRAYSDRKAALGR